MDIERAGAGWLRATGFEFRNRFWMIAVIFFLGFQFYAVDHVPAGWAMAQRLARHTLLLGQPTDRHVLQAVFGCGALLVALAAALRTWAAAYLQSEVVHAPSLHTEALVAAGPYRYTRNPLYLGGILLGIGIGLAASRSGFVFIVVALTIFYFRLIFREEAELRASQSESYRRFLLAVPRLMPSVWPRVPASSERPKWAQACAGELFMWLFAACAGLYAVTLNGRYFAISTLGAVALGALAGGVAKRRERERMAAAQ